MRAQPSSDAEQVRAARGFVSTAVLLGVLILASVGFQLALGKGPSWLRTQRAAYAAVWPQGWAMFSRVSRQDNLVVYAVEPGDRLTPSTRPGLSAEHWWGIRRTGYAQMVQTTEIAEQVPASGWRACGGTTLNGCWRSWSSERVPPGWPPVTNRSHQPSLCGRLLIAEQAPARWRAGRATEPGTVRIAAVEVACRR